MRLGLSAVLWRVSGAKHPIMACVWDQVPLYGMPLGLNAIYTVHPELSTVLWHAYGAKHHFMAGVWG